VKHVISYIRLQLKRAGRVFPAAFFLVLILMTGSVLLGAALLHIRASGSDRQILKIAITGKTDDPYIQTALSLMEHLDDTRFEVIFLEMDEEMAAQSLKKDDVSAYVVIPDGFVDSIIHGENHQVVYVTKGTSADLIVLLADEMMDAISEMLVESQTAIYTLQDILNESGKTDLLWNATEEINLQYFDLIMSRGKLYELKLIGEDGGLSLTSYMFCAATVILLMLAGIQGIPLYVSTDRSAQKLMKARGISSFAQVTGEYIAWLFLMLSVIILLEFSLKMFLPQVVSSELFLPMAENWILFFTMLLPTTAMTVSEEMLIYECSEGSMSAISRLLLCTLTMGYLGGCFYPSSVFPDPIRQISDWIPTGAALRLLENAMSGTLSLRHLGIELIYLIIFLVLSVLLRDHHLTEADH
jgi:ABC-type uncharacterized transport system permease subunit